MPDKYVYFQDISELSCFCSFSGVFEELKVRVLKSIHNDYYQPFRLHRILHDYSLFLAYFFRLNGKPFSCDLWSDSFYSKKCS